MALSDLSRSWTATLHDLQLRLTLIVSPEAVSDGVMRLEAGNIVHCFDDLVGLSRCVKHLDALDPSTAGGAPCA